MIRNHNHTKYRLASFLLLLASFYPLDISPGGDEAFSADTKVLSLLEAARSGDTVQIQTLLDSGVDVNARYLRKDYLELPFGQERLEHPLDRWAALGVATVNRQSAAVTLLLQRGASVDAPTDPNNQTALSLICSTKAESLEDNQIAQLLLAHNADPNKEPIAPGPCGARATAPPLFRACAWNKPEIVKTLIAANANVNRNFWSTPLYQATTQNLPTIIAALIASEKVIFSNNSLHDNAETVWLAVHEGYEQAFTELLKAKDAPINHLEGSHLEPHDYRKALETTPLAEAIYTKRYAMAERLLADPRTDVNVVCSLPVPCFNGTSIPRITAFEFAQKIGDTEAIALFKRFVPLHAAVLGNDTEQVARLIVKADFTIPANRYVLWHAARTGNTAMVRELLKAENIPLNAVYQESKSAIGQNFGDATSALAIAIIAPQHAGRLDEIIKLLLADKRIDIRVPCIVHNHFDRDGTEQPQTTPHEIGKRLLGNRYLPQYLAKK